VIEEQAVLAAVLTTPSAFVDIADIVSADDFQSSVNAHIYGAFEHLTHANTPIDVVTVTNALRQQGMMPLIGDDYIRELADNPRSATNIVHHAQIVRRKSLRRQVRELGQVLAGIEDDKDPEEALDEGYARLLSIAEHSSSKDPTNATILLEEITAETIRANEAQLPPQGITTGLDTLDALLRVIYPAEYMVLAARPSMGKTALAMNICTHVADIHGPVLFASLEMTEQQLGQRILSSDSGVALERITGCYLSKTDAPKMLAATAAAKDRQLYIDDKPSQSIMDIRIAARRLQAKHKLHLLCVDYMQLATSGGRHQNRNDEVSAISAGLKAIGKDLGVPMLVLSQLGRTSEREKRRPELVDLRESGSIEQDADGAILLYSPQGITEASEVEVDLIVAKRRMGKTGTVRAVFDKKHQRFRSRY
jgi:replicative DNA helicase